MRIVGWIFFTLGVGCVFAAFACAFIKRRAVRYPVWARAGSMAASSAFMFAVSRMCFCSDNVTLAIIGGSFALSFALFSAHICAFSVEEREDGIVVGGRIRKSFYPYSKVVCMRADLSEGIKSVTVGLGSHRIKLYRFMQGFDNFMDKMIENKIFSVI